MADPSTPQPASATDERAPSKAREEIIKEASRIEESLLHSSKGHFAAAQMWGGWHYWFGIPMVVLSAIAGASAFSKFDNGHVIAGALSIVVAVLSALNTFLNPRERVNSHFQAGNNYDALMNRVRLFRVIDCWGTDADEILTDKLRHFSAEKDKLNGSCPQIPRPAYLAGKRGIASGEADFAVDAKQ